MRSCKTLAILLTKFLEVSVLLLQDCLGSISLLLVAEVLVSLVVTHMQGGTVLVLILVAPLLRQYVVFVLDYKVYVVAKVLIETVELRAKLVVKFKLLLK
jgi:hypothetical protein